MLTKVRYRLTCPGLSQSATSRVWRKDSIEWLTLSPSTTSTAQICAKDAYRHWHSAVMSSQRQEQPRHQDYIAKIRYSNQLPPPPNPPKLLDIPGGGLAEGKYTQAQYAASLARAQPLNIEADAELGMPLDLIGIPGVFHGDERGRSHWTRMEQERRF